MAVIILQIFGSAVLISAIFLSVFLLKKRRRLKKKFQESEAPSVDDYEKILSASFQKSFLKDYQGAIEEINRALKIKPHLEKLYFQRARMKEEMKDYDGAKADYTKAILLNPGYDLAYLNRGLLKIKLEEYSGARKDLNKALELNSNLSEAQFFKHEAEMKVKQIQKSQRDQIKINFDNSKDNPKSNLN